MLRDIPWDNPIQLLLYNYVYIAIYNVQQGVHCSTDQVSHFHNSETLSNYSALIKILMMNYNVKLILLVGVLTMNAGDVSCQSFSRQDYDFMLPLAFKCFAQYKDNFYNQVFIENSIGEVIENLFDKCEDIVYNVVVQRLTTDEHDKDSLKKFHDKEMIRKFLRTFVAKLVTYLGKRVVFTII